MGYQPQRKIRFQVPAAAAATFSPDNTFDNSSSRNDYYEMTHNNNENKITKDDLPSIFSFLNAELTREYALEHAEDSYSSRREKIYSFMRIPKEVEKFMVYGFMQCIDSFLYVYTFLPIRVLFILFGILTRPFSRCFGLVTRRRRELTPAEICDLLKAVILVICSILMYYVDTSILYHKIKSQSVIKLYIFYNMLEIGDRLFSSFGQDAIDALFWTATEKRVRKREHLGTIPHLIFAVVYVMLHSLLVLLQATTLNVAINSRNKTLMTIMMSNNFVELKGSVFKKFDKNNLFQVSCSDVRERFHLFILLLIVSMQTMREYSWKMEQSWDLIPACIVVLIAEALVDWIKHAFITRFNELSLDVYRDYTISLAYDVAQTRQKHASSDHSDLVARRMGFIPLPLGVVMVRVFIHSIQLQSVPSYCVFFVFYLCIVTFKVANSLLTLGRACDLITQHKSEKTTTTTTTAQTSSSPSMMHTISTPIVNRKKTLDIATSPTHPNMECKQASDVDVNLSKSREFHDLDDNSVMPLDHLGPSAIFANSNVDLKNASLNEELLKIEDDEIRIEQQPQQQPCGKEGVTKSFPDIQSSRKECLEDGGGGMKRSESVPTLNSVATSTGLDGGSPK